MRPLYSVLIIFCWYCLTSSGFADSTISKSTLAKSTLAKSTLAKSTLAKSTTDPDSPVIVVMGDSLSASFGIDQSHAWVTLMAERLRSQGYPHHIFNASISGETSRGGLKRLPDILLQKPRIVILELGANDGLRGLSLNSLRENLDKMIILSLAAGAKVLLIGMELPPNYGPAYTVAFKEIYTELANKHEIKLVPFFLEGIATNRKLMQKDNMHPNGVAQPLLLNNIWPHLASLLTSTTQ